MERNGIIVGSLAALNLAAIVTVEIVSGSVPEVLATSFAVLVGAVAGVTVPRKTP